MFDAETLRNVAVPLLTVRLDHRGREKDEIAFASLVLRRMIVGSGLILLECESQDRRFRAAVALDFANERFIFDPQNETTILDDGSPQAIEYAITRLRFIRGMVLNGRTEAVNANTGERLGITNPNIPVNIDVNRTIENLDSALTELRAERARRELPQSDGGSASGGV